MTCLSAVRNSMLNGVPRQVLQLRITSISFTRPVLQPISMLHCATIMMWIPGYLTYQGVLAHGPSNQTQIYILTSVGSTQYHILNCLQDICRSGLKDQSNSMFCWENIRPPSADTHMLNPVLCHVDSSPTIFSIMNKHS